MKKTVKVVPIPQISRSCVTIDWWTRINHNDIAGTRFIIKITSLTLLVLKETTSNLPGVHVLILRISNANSFTGTVN
jgi:hypothetical protein